MSDSLLSIPCISQAFAHSYLLGTIVVEHVTRLLGRTRLETHRPPSTSPFPAWFSRTSRPESRHDTNEKTRIIGFSRSRSRFYTLLCATSLHAVFFVIMGSKSGYPSMMIAYVISSFARSFITGECYPAAQNSPIRPTTAFSDIVCTGTY